MNWNSIHRNTVKADTRQRLLAILASQGVLTEALLTAARNDSDDVLEIEITEFEGCFEEEEDLDEDDETRSFGQGGPREKKRQSQ